MMDAAPPRQTGKSLDHAHGYRCPLCHVQTTADAVDTEWVMCPMIAHRPLCFGCCLDHQSAARAREFERFEFRSLYEETATTTGQHISTLRLTCLRHQEELSSASFEARRTTGRT